MQIYKYKYNPGTSCGGSEKERTEKEQSQDYHFKNKIHCVN